MLTTENQPVLEMKEVSKSFPGVVALDRVSFDLIPGEVHALVGENGAGKSTLIKILGGVYSLDKGEILINRNPVKIDNPIHATRQGIAIIHQELNVIRGLSVADNIFLGEHPVSKLGFINEKELHEKSQVIIKDLNLNLSTKAYVGNLSMAAWQLVLIAQAIARRPRILVLDEPTSSLGESDIDQLFNVLTRLKNQEVGIIYISHKLDEVFRISDRISVLRDGKLVSTQNATDTNQKEVVRLMVGRELTEMYPKRAVDIGNVAMEVRDFKVEGSDVPVNFYIRKGEILGVFGLLGAGRTRLVQSLFGVEAAKGKVKIEGKEVRIKNPIDAFRAGLGMLPIERKTQGLVLPLSIENNLLLGNFPRYTRIGFMRNGMMAKSANYWIDVLQIHCTGRRQITRNQSGGNQQKVVLGRLLESRVKILMLNEPTRGIDVGAKVEIYNLMGELCAQGNSIMFITSELPELLALSDRILVMSSGRITGEFTQEEATPEKIMTAVIAIDQKSIA